MKASASSSSSSGESSGGGSTRRVAETTVGWVLRSEDGKVQIDLPVGSTTVLGRNELRLTDKRVSRHQAEIRIERKNGKLTARLVVKGVNACYVKSTEEEGYVGRDEEQELNSDDTICFCGQSYPFILKTASAPSSSSGTSVAGKRKLSEDDEREAEEEEIDEAPQPAKKRRIGSAELEPANEALSLAFPSFGTGVFQFDIQRAAKVACEKVAEFLEAHDDPRIRLYAVDISESSTLAALRKHWQDRDARFQIKVANITKLKTEGIPCRVIANASNEWFSAQGSGVNLAINKAAGPALDKETKARYKGNGRAGHVYPVPLPPSSPLRSNEGVHHVVHVMAPNMNPQRNNCLHGDYVKGEHVLGQCYSRLLKTFWDLVTGDKDDEPTRQDKEEEEDEIEEVDFAPRKSHQSTSSSKSGGGNAFSMLMTSAKKAPASATKAAASTDETKAPKQGGWSDVLTPYCTHPERVPPTVMHQYDDKTVCIFDKFPKAFKHMLILPRKLIPGYSALTADDVPLLKEMLKRGNMTMEQLQAQYPTAKFRLGFHAVPSMRQIHMHLISQDFDSPHLKTKKHWNSFTTEFFIDAEKFINMLATKGKIELDKAKYEALLQAPLKCHVCRAEMKTMPLLKGHILTH